MTYLCYKAFLYRIELVYFMENYNMDLNEIGSWASIIVAFSSHEASPFVRF